MSTIAGTASPTLGPAVHDEHADNRRRIWAIVGGSSGNLVEWYDFYAYSFAALYFAPSFFPSGDRTSQLLNTAGIFAAGFLMRPLGGWLFGKLADKRGRRMSMMTAMLIMCAGSLMVAVLPTYATIGNAAPALLLVARLIQGVSVGGEYGISATYMSEVAKSGRRGFLGSFQYVTLIGGQLLAVLVMFALQQVMSTEEIKAWGWRVPFFIGAAAAVVALFLRRSLHETTTAAERAGADVGTLAGLLQHKRAVLTVLGFTAGGSLIFYTLTTYMQKYLVNTAGMSAKTATATMTGVLFVYMILQPVFGALSDRIGRKKSMLAFGLLSDADDHSADECAVERVQSAHRVPLDHVGARGRESLHVDQRTREGRDVPHRRARTRGRLHVRHRECDLRRQRRIRRTVVQAGRPRDLVLCLRGSDVRDRLHRRDPDARHRQERPPAARCRDPSEGLNTVSRAAR